MPATKPTSKFIYFALTLLLLLGLSVSIMGSEPTPDANDDDDLEGIEELIALDEEEEANQQEEGGHARFSEAEVLSKAQRIVLELNGESAKRVIDENEFVLVLGYTPWCVRSAELMPHFAEAATWLKDSGSPLLMAKLDAERFPKVASTLGIKGFPTLLLFVNGSSLPYTGGFSSEEIVTWARKRTSVPVTRLSTVAEAKEFVEKHSTFLIGLFKNFEGPNYEEFVKAATSDNEIQFVEASNTDVAKVLFPDCKSDDLFLGLVKSEPERYTTYESTFEVDKILQFLDYNKFPLITTLTDFNSIRVYSSPMKLQVLVFAKSDDLRKLLEPLQDVARKFKTKIIFLHVDITNDGLAKPYLTLFGLEESEGIIVTAFDNQISSKYLLESDPTPKHIEEFCEGLLQNSLSPFFKSQPIPDNNETGIQIIVGKTFDDLILSSPKNVLLEVHTPWCIKCETISKQVEKLAKHFKGVDNLVFARIDASANDHPKLEVNDFPTLLFYPGSNKSNPTKLSIKSSLKDMAAFINKNIRDQDEQPKDEL